MIVQFNSPSEKRKKQSPYKFQPIRWWDHDIRTLAFSFLLIGHEYKDLLGLLN